MSIQSKGFTPIKSGEVAKGYTDSEVRSKPSPRAAVPAEVRVPLDGAADRSASIAHNVPGHHPEGGIRAATDAMRTAPGPDVVPKGGARALTDSDIGSASGKPPASVK